MNFFDEASLRLKQVLKVTEDQQLAAALGLAANAWAMRKKRGSFPEKELRALAQQRPDLKIDVDYVLAGVEARPDLLGVKQAAMAAAERVGSRGLAGPNVDVALGRNPQALKAAAAAPDAAQADEQRLLAAFRSSDSAGRAALLLVAQAVAQRSK